MYKKKLKAEEILHEIKLRMSYDSSKTLNENKILIQEQEAVNPQSDATELKREIDKFNSDENKIANIIGKYKKASDFKQMVDLFTTYYGDFGKELYRAVDSNDPVESKQIINSLKQIGVTATNPVDKRGFGTWTFDFGKTSAPTTTEPVSKRQKNINNTYCTVRNGVINLPGSTWNNTKWDLFVDEYKISEQEISAAKASCEKTKQKTQTPIPSELVNSDGVKVFQNWLDLNHPGWATGYKDGVLKQGQNGGGYGSFGPRTQAAWNNQEWRQEYLSGSGTDVKRSGKGQSPESLTPIQTQRQPTTPKAAPTQVASTVKPVNLQQTEIDPNDMNF